MPGQNPIEKSPVARKATTDAINRDCIDTYINKLVSMKRDILNKGQLLQILLRNVHFGTPHLNHLIEVTKSLK